MDFLKNFKNRQWLYGIVVAGIAIAVGYGFVTSDQADLWIRLVEAVLSLIPAGALALAASKAKPAATDSGVSEPTEPAEPGEYSGR